jgi:hypothetical protein
MSAISPKADVIQRGRKVLCAKSDVPKADVPRILERTIELIRRNPADFGENICDLTSAEDADAPNQKIE